MDPRQKNGLVEDLFRPLSRARADQRALEWQQKIDPTAMVGTRHHIVPRFHLARFANDRDQLTVRDRATGGCSTRAIRDMAETDFNTFVDTFGNLDSSFETMFSEVETAAANVVRRHLDARSFYRPRGLFPDERSRIDTYTAIQITRGRRPRRVGELLTDYTVKLLNQGQLSDEQMAAFEFAPHPNEHLQMSAVLSERALHHLSRRSVGLLFLDAPLLLIGDEPVLVFGQGLEDAESIWMPLSPSALLIYGASGNGTNRRPTQSRGSEATEIADIANSRTIHNALDWVAARQDHQTFRTMVWPPTDPVLRVTDGGSQISEQINNAPHRRPRRLPRDDE